MQNIITLIPVLAPLLLFSYALVAILNADSRIIKLKNTTQYLGAFGILVAIISAGLVTQYDTFQSATIGWNELGFSIRLDALSMTMFTMISLLGFIILRFSTNYLDGDARQAIFLARLATTIASVELLVLSGNLG
ncbi:MAG: NAD(P)H-quinone oxidoreductase subunit 5, partial [Cyclobacteriaceae bacterium]